MMKYNGSKQSKFLVPNPTFVHDVYMTKTKTMYLYMTKTLTHNFS